MSGVVYILCALTSLICSVLLLRGYARSGVRLLLWSGLCFVGLTLENVILYLGMQVILDIDMSLWRKIPGVIALALLLFGLIWDEK
jgi:hypothetical protein